MVRHIVFWQLKDELKHNGAPEVIADLRKSFVALSGKIDGLTRIDFGPNYKDGPYDIALSCEFVSREAEAAYQIIPPSGSQEKSRRRGESAPRRGGL